MAGTHIGVDCNYGIDRKIQMARWQQLQTVWIGKIDEPGDFGILGRECESEARGGLLPHVTNYNYLSIPVPGCRHCHHTTLHIVFMDNRLKIMVTPVISGQRYIGHIRPMVIYDPIFPMSQTPSLGENHILQNMLLLESSNFIAMG
jgi:hypothetical protein